MRHISEPVSSVELIDIAPSEHSPLISKCTIKVCYVSDAPNRNRSVITKDKAREMAPSLRGAIIAGLFNKEKDDFEDHARTFEGVDEDGNFKFSSNVRPYGFVDVGARVWFQNFKDDEDKTRTYLCTEGWLWTSAYPEAKKVIEEGRGQSMELDRDSLKGTWSNDNNHNYEFFIINEAIIEKLTILGEDVEPCFEGASVTGAQTQFSLDDDFKERVYSMLAELKELLLEEGGEIPMEQEKNPAVVEEEEILPSDYKKKDEEEEEKKDSQQEEDTSEKEEAEEEGSNDKEDEPEEEEDKKKKKDYALEYEELLERYNTLESNYSALQTEKSNLETELTALREFKATKDREEKQDMIDSFSMLEDEDKKDVQDNIDSYTVEQIEEKLSVICVRKKINFSVDENENDATTYNLNSDEAQSEPEVPAWIRAINAVVAENN